MSFTESWIAGYFTPSTIAIYAIIHILQISVGLYICYRVFIAQNPYSIFTHTISFLGSSDLNRNPKGWWLFSIMIVCTGLLFLPTFQFLSRRLSEISIIAAIIFSIFGWLGALGLVTLGFFPSNEPPRFRPPKKTVGEIHDAVAVSSIICLFLAIVVMGFTLLLPDTTPPFVSFGYNLAMAIFAIGIPIRIAWVIKCKRNRSLKAFPGDGIYSLPLWEWILFGLLYFLIYWSAIFI